MAYPGREVEVIMNIPKSLRRLRRHARENAAAALGRRHTTLAAKAVIFDRDGRVLLIRRSATDRRRPLTWDLPGGTVKYGEDPFEAVQREVLEETGLKVHGWRPADVSSKFGQDDKQRGHNGKVYVVRLAFAAYVRGHHPVPVLSYEHDQYEWTYAPNGTHGLPKHWLEAIHVAQGAEKQRIKALPGAS